ncbi:MAG: ABC transporter substrate-binding protein [Deltaproteobacteria bacterium]|nr:ABC transporter substrate-binding protein [Deltaproteobacteria bacterium]
MFRRLGLLLAALFWAASPALADEAPDARSVYGATPPATFTLYALDPELLAGWNTPLRDYEKKFIPAKYHDLPILGGWYGQGFVPDREMLLASGIKKAFYLSTGFHDALPITETLGRLGMEVISVPGARLADLPLSFRAMGWAFGREERGEALAAYAETVLGKVGAALGNLPTERHARVYVALEADGQASVCRDSERAEVFRLAGAVSVHQCPPGATEAFLRVTFEQIMRYDPEVILVFHPNLMRQIPGDPRWQNLPAVRRGRVYFIPRGPFSWLERPASYMRLIGAQWLAGTLHPDLYEVDIRDESAKFMKLFFNLDLTGEEIDQLFEPYGTF